MNFLKRKLETTKELLGSSGMMRFKVLRFWELEVKKNPEKMPSKNS